MLFEKSLLNECQKVHYNMAIKPSYCDTSILPGNNTTNRGGNIVIVSEKVSMLLLLPLCLELQETWDG